MSLLDLLRSLDERGITIEVAPKFIRSVLHAPTTEDAEAARPHREALIRVALARTAMREVLALEQEYAGYPARRTPELEDRITKAKNTVLYLLPEDLPWEIVARLRPDGTTVQPSVALELAS